MYCGKIFIRVTVVVLCKRAQDTASAATQIENVEFRILVEEDVARVLVHVAVVRVKAALIAPKNLAQAIAHRRRRKPKHAEPTLRIRWCHNHSNRLVEHRLVPRMRVQVDA